LQPASPFSQVYSNFSAFPFYSPLILNFLHMFSF